jgi:hypothetical protein
VDKLKHPFHSQAWTAPETFACAEVVAKLYLRAEVKIVYSEMATYLIPQLWLADEHSVSCLLLAEIVSAMLVFVNAVVFPPEIGETTEAQALHIKQILHSPYHGKLHWHFLIGAFNSLVEGFEVKSVLEVLRVNEIVYTKQPGVVDIVTSVNTAVVFRVEAQWSELRVLPEIEAARNLTVCAA